MRPLNCWEARACGREPGGAKVDEMGVCPAATESRLHGCNRGSNGGRACWAVPNTECAKTFNTVEKFTHCLQCAFFNRVDEEEGRNFEVMGLLREKLR